MLATDAQSQAYYFYADIARKSRGNDQLFEETGIERHDLERAIKYYY